METGSEFWIDDRFHNMPEDKRDEAYVLSGKTALDFIIREHKLNGNVRVTRNADYSFCSYRKWFYANAAGVNKTKPFAANIPDNRNISYENIRNEAAEKNMLIYTGPIITKTI